MDDPNRVVLDISSDEDVGWGESGATSEGGGGGGGGVRDDGDWISEILKEVKKTIDDPDELMVVGQFTPNPRKRSFTKCVEDDDDDDDCVILDGDPDKPITIENDGGDDEDSDELCVVSEKGQVACRDYPHPRHLCVKFPFSSTPRERHCDQCHCYVCDSVAPCVLWGTGASITDHCHATEKDEYWKAARKAKKTSSKAQPLISGFGSTPVIQLSSLPNNPLIQNQELPGSQPCSVTNVSRPNSARPIRTQVPDCDPTSRFRQQLVSHQLQRHNVGHADSRAISHPVPFKRARVTGGVLTTNSYGNNSSGNNCSYQYSRNQSPVQRWQGTPGGGGGPMLSTYQGSNHSNLGGVTAHSAPNSPPPWSPINDELGNYAPSEPRISSQVPNSSINTNSTAVHHPQVFPQSCTGSSNFANSMPTVVPTLPTEQSWGSPYENLVPLQPQVALQPNVASTRQNVMPPRSLVTSHGYINNAGSCASAPEVGPFQPNTGIPLQNPSSYQQQLSEQPPVIPDSSDFSFNQVPPTTQNSQTLPVNGTQLQPAIANPHRVDSEFDSWRFEDDPALDYLEFPMSPGLDLYSPGCWSPL